MKTLEKESKDIRDQIGRLEKEREDIQNNLDNISGVSTETKEEKEIRIWAEKRIQDLNSYIKTAKRELQKSCVDNKEESSLTRKTLFNIALDAKTKEINRTRELIMTLHKSETTARKNRKDLEFSLELSLDQMDDLEKEYNKT